MDFRLFVSRHLGEPVKQGRKWWVWHCNVNKPDKNPSLKVEPNGFKCFSCGAWAEVGKGVPVEVAFLVRELGWTWAAAFRELGDYQDRGPRPVPSPAYAVGFVPPTEEWRKAFGEQLERAQFALNDSRVFEGAAYLLQRGYREATWQQFGLGYVGAWVRLEAFDTWFAEGIVFPAVVKGELWSLEVRVTSETGPKYHRPKGGTEPVPFGLGQLEGGDVLVVCEGAFDALAAWQVCEGDVDVVALRGAGNQLDFWERYLTQSRKILALDADDAGDDCARRLLAKHPTWERRRPPDGMDLGDMLKAGVLSREWLLKEVRL